MSYKKRKMNKDDAIIISKWTYSKPYEIYSFDGSQTTVDEFINEGYCSVYYGDALVGYYCAGISAQVPTEKSKEIYNDDSYIDFGLGIKPQLTGKGKGRAFFAFIMECIKNEYPDKKLRLTVAAFNKRAIHLYSSFDFEERFAFKKTNSDDAFIIMNQA